MQSYKLFPFLALVVSCFPHLSLAQSMGRAGTITGTVTDPSEATVAGAKVTIQNKVTGFNRNATTDQSGAFRFTDVPPNNYHVEVAAGGFQTSQQDVTIRTSVPINLAVTLKLASENTSIEVHSDSSELVESVPTSHTDLDSAELAKLPLSNTGSGISDAITMASPGVVADSNGFFHPLGDHAETGFSFDNQPVTDQQSKQFSTSMPVNAIASMEVIAGAPPAEFGDKGSLVVNAITKSGLGQTKPTGSLSANVGSFGTYGENFTYGIGNAKVGNFLVANWARSGRYLDSPEFAPLHDRGNNVTIFNRSDYQPTQYDTLHLNLFFSRAQFETPNTYDQQSAGQDQKQRIKSYNIAPGYVHVFGATTSITINPFFRQDQVLYSPSGNVFSDLPATVGQSRRLSNLGVKTDLSYVHGIHNIKIGAQATHTFLTEHFNFGVTDPTFIDPLQQPGLLPYDLTRRRGRQFTFNGHTDVKQEAFYVQDNITLGQLTLQAGLRGDIYRGLSAAKGVQPRLGASYLYKPTATAIRLSYSRFFETPYNENLVLSSVTGAGGLASNTFGAFGSTPLSPGRRDQYNAGIQQGIGKLIVIDAGYFWKYTHNAFDFDNLFNTPISFPIEWRKSKIDGFSMRVNLTEYKGFSAFTVLGHTRARFFGPEIGGLIFNSPLNNSVFRIDHDQALQQTTHLRYQRKKDGPWLAFTWRYDSGFVAGRVPDLASAFSLSGDQQASIRFQCGNTFATISSPITSCAGNAVSRLINIPKEGTQNDDTNPARIAPRNLFDLGAGIDNLFHTERPRFTLQVTAVNVTNTVALYNFLSTFSGTHFVTPRSYSAEIGMVW